MKKPAPEGRNSGDVSERKSGPEDARGKASSPRSGRPARAAPPRGVFVAVAVCVLAVASLVGLIAWQSQAPVSSAGAEPRIGGPFHLVNQDGQAVDQHILDGRWSAVFFGYTYCPDTCPATLQALGAASRQLGPDAKPFQTVFITVDPARDTPAQMKTYLSSQGFPAHVVGLTGTPAEIAEAAKSYSVYYARSGSGADYTMDHSAAVYLMDPHGRFARPLAHDMTPALIAEQIKAAQG